METPEIERILADIEREIELPDEVLRRLGWVIRIMYRLRAPDGCPWDRAQTHHSLLKNLLEEAYEYIDTVADGDDELMREELGDLFMQVVFHCEIAGERSAFDIGEVARDLAYKLVRRHPHVFGDREVSSEDEALDSWNDAKGTESAARFSLAKVPKSMPALLRARKVQEKAAQVGFQWEDIRGAMEKLDEELAEFKHAAREGNDASIHEELGDLLFGVVNVARYLKQSPEVALTATTDKFIRRFRHIENRLAAEGRTPAESSLEEMDRYWHEAKRLEHIPG